MSVTLGQHKDDVRLGRSYNSVLKHVRDGSHAINWEKSRMVLNSNDFNQRLVVEAALIKTLPYSISSKSTLAVNKSSSS